MKLTYSFKFFVRTALYEAYAGYRVPNTNLQNGYTTKYEIILGASSPVVRASKQKFPSVTLGMHFLKAGPKFTTNGFQTRPFGSPNGKSSPESSSM